MSQISEAQVIKGETEASQNTAARVGGLLESLAGRTGWIDYVDTQYSEGSPFELSADTDTLLPNNAGTVVDDHAPKNGDTDIALYSGGLITGRQGDGLAITIDFKAKPTEGATTYIEVWVDITGGTGTPAALASLYKRIITFPKGNGVERPINFTTMAYTLDTWASNGGAVYVRANGTADLYDIRFVIHRTHRNQL